MALRRLATDISERDATILRVVGAHRFLTTKHIESLLFIDHATTVSAARACRRVLRRLHAAQLVATLDRRVGGVRAGSASHIWHLTHAGARLLAFLDGHGRHTRFHEPSQRLLDHCLMIADIHLTLRHQAGDGQFELLGLQLEPASWRTYTGLGGERRLLRPDLAITTANEEYEDHWFLEADTGSEHPPTVVRACRRYLEYFATGIEQQAHGVIPRVVWTVLSELRAEKLQAEFTRARLDQQLFRVTTLAGLGQLIREGAE